MNQCGKMLNKKLQKVNYRLYFDVVRFIILNKDFKIKLELFYLFI